MTSNSILIALIVQYVLLFAFFLYEGEYTKATYWSGYAISTLALYWMK